MKCTSGCKNQKSSQKLSDLTKGDLIRQAEQEGYELLTSTDTN